MLIIIMSSNFYTCKAVSNFHAFNEDLRTLIKLEVDVIRNENALSEYINGKEEKRLLKYDVEHPLDIYFLFKHWKELRSKAENETERTDFIILLPSSEDLNNEVLNLLRLQEVYNLKTNEISNGDIAGRRSVRRLDAKDCEFVAKTAFDNLLFDQFQDWFKFAINKANKEQKAQLRDEFESMHAKMLMLTGLFKMSSSGMSGALGEVLNQGSLMAKVKEDKNWTMVFDKYKKLCRHSEDEENPARVHPDAVCFYHGNEPFSRWQPNKVPITLLHSVVHVVCTQLCPLSILYIMVSGTRTEDKLKENIFIVGRNIVL